MSCLFFFTINCNDNFHVYCEFSKKVLIQFDCNFNDFDFALSTACTAHCCQESIESLIKSINHFVSIFFVRMRLFVTSCPHVITKENLSKRCQSIEVTKIPTLFHLSCVLEFYQLSKNFVLPKSYFRA